MDGVSTSRFIFRLTPSTTLISATRATAALVVTMTKISATVITASTTNTTRRFTGLPHRTLEISMVLIICMILSRYLLLIFNL